MLIIQELKTMRNFNQLKIAVAGTGYVGLSIATLLSQHHEVAAVDVIPEKVDKLNHHISPIQDEYIENIWQRNLCISQQPWMASQLIKMQTS